MGIEPRQIFRNGLLIAAPHMDDGVLACGGTVASLPDRERVHFVYATDGSRSPIPMFPRQRALSSQLARIRMAEAREALAVLGVPGENVHFLNLPDGALGAHQAELERKLSALVRELGPQHVLAPFRYDRHPDHLALHATVARIVDSAESKMTMLEYFVYYRWQMLPGNDVRRYLQPDQLMWVDTAPYADEKMAALRCFKSQTTLYFGWQERPILQPALIEEAATKPEWFLRWDPRCPGTEVFSELRHWFQFVRRVEPRLKQTKEKVIALTGMRRWAKW